MIDYGQAYDILTDMLKYDNVETRPCQEELKRLGTEENSKDISKICIFVRKFTSGK
jgi:hypothetical protein